MICEKPSNGCLVMFKAIAMPDETRWEATDSLLLFSKKRPQHDLLMYYLPPH